MSGRNEKYGLIRKDDSKIWCDNVSERDSEVK